MSEPAAPQPSSQSGMTFTFPSAAEVKKATKPVETEVRDYVKLPDNLAEETDLAKSFHNEAYSRFQRFVGQASRTELEENLRSADAMWRLAKRKGRTVKGSAQQQDTLSNVAASQFYKSVRLVSSGQTSMIFGQQDELPAQYDPPREDASISQDEAQRVANADNLLLNYTWEKDGWEEKIKQAIRRVNKNSIQVMSLEWEYKTEKRVERVPGYYTAKKEPVSYRGAKPDAAPMFDYSGKPISSVLDANGKPRSFVFIEKTKVVKNCPVLELHDMKNVYFDLDIPDMRNQSCVVIRTQKSLGDLLAMQRDGMFKNVEKLSQTHLYESETNNSSTVDTERDTNAGYQRDMTENGLIDLYHVYMVSPVDEKGKKWDSDVVPEFYEAVYAGPFGTFADKEADDKDKAKATSVCLMLRRLPYHHGHLPLYVIYSHDDERGAVRMGYQTLLECNYEQQVSRQNQWHDNNELAVRSPWVGEKGNVLSRDLKFRNGNQVMWVKPGTGQTALTKLSVPDMTQRFISEMDMLRKDADEICGTTDVMRGVAMGARTTGTEAMGAREQAMMPAIEDAKVMADQIFKPILADHASLWRQFGDPRAMITVTRSNVVLGTVSPGELYGECNVRVVSVAKYQTDMASRQVINNAISSGVYEKSAGFMGKDGALEFWRTWARLMRFPNAQKIFPGARKYVEAENQAWADVEAIKADPVKAMNDPAQLPKPDEMHDIHIGILQQVRDKYVLLAKATPGDEKDAAIVAALDLYMLMHEQFKEQEAVQVSGGGQGAEPSEDEQQPEGMGGNEMPNMPGSAQGEMMAGVGGQMA